MSSGATCEYTDPGSTGVSLKTEGLEKSITDPR
jgi:hypothetical protein